MKMKIHLYVRTYCECIHKCMYGLCVGNLWYLGSMLELTENFVQFWLLCLCVQRTLAMVTNAFGILFSQQDPESSSTHWKWSQLATTNAKLNCISDNPVEPCALEDEDGEFTEKESHHFRFKAQKELPRVTWHMERRSWLSSSSCKGWVSTKFIFSIMKIVCICTMYVCTYVCTYVHLYKHFAHVLVYS